MKNFILFLSFIISANSSYSQVSATLNFDISFSLEIVDNLCYPSHPTINQDSVIVDFFFIYHFSPISAVVQHDKSNNSVKIKGQYTYLLSGQDCFYPMLVLTVKPIPTNLEYCADKVSTYLVDLQNIKLPKPTPRDGISIEIDKIMLNDHPYLTIHGPRKVKAVSYDGFQSKRMSSFLQYSFPHWHLIKKVTE